MPRHPITANCHLVATSPRVESENWYGQTTEKIEGDMGAC